MSIVSKCCNAEIARHHGREYPAGPVFHIDIVWSSCSKCNEEWPETLEACAVCGDGHDHLIETILGSTCQNCCETYSDEICRSLGR